MEFEFFTYTTSPTASCNDAKSFTSPVNTAELTALVAQLVPAFALIVGCVVPPSTFCHVKAPVLGTATVAPIAPAPRSALVATTKESVVEVRTLYSPSFSAPRPLPVNLT